MSHRRFGGRGFVRDCRGIFFFNYTPRDVQKNYRYTLRVVRERLAGYEYTVYQIYERVVNSAFPNVTSTLWSKLSSYIYFLILDAVTKRKSFVLSLLRAYWSTSTAWLDDECLGRNVKLVTNNLKPLPGELYGCSIVFVSRFLTRNFE